MISLRVEYEILTIILSSGEDPGIYIVHSDHSPSLSFVIKFFSPTYPCEDSKINYPDMIQTIFYIFYFISLIFFTDPIK